jgi:phytoene dehydrogenase-like protein
MNAQESYEMVAWAKTNRDRLDSLQQAFLARLEAEEWRQKANDAASSSLQNSPKTPTGVAAVGYAQK